MTVKHTLVSSDMRVFALCSLMELHRGDSARSSCSGYGLGLAIAAETAGKHRAKIGMEYRDGMNCFYLTVRRR